MMPAQGAVSTTAKALEAAGDGEEAVIAILVAGDMGLDLLGIDAGADFSERKGHGHALGRQR